MTRPLYTIGYQGCQIEQTIDALTKAGVQLLIDVRAIPISRKQGYSKYALKQHLEQRHIDYLHLKALGNTKEGRDAAYNNNPEWQQIFKRALQHKEAQQHIQQAIQSAENAIACLLCFEHDHQCCHRLLVAEEMQKRTQPHNTFHLHHLAVNTDA